MASKIKYVTPNAADIKGYISLALDNKLYVKDFCLEGWYMDALTLPCNKKEMGRPYVLLTMAFDGDTPVGICFVYGSVLSVYVKPFYRRKGIGTQLMSELLVTHDIEGTYIVDKGIKGSDAFYRKQGLEILTHNQQVK